MRYFPLLALPFILLAGCDLLGLGGEDEWGPTQIRVEAQGDRFGYGIAPFGTQLKGPESLNESDRTVEKEEGSLTTTLTPDSVMFAWVRSIYSDSSASIAVIVDESNEELVSVPNPTSRLTMIRIEGGTMETRTEGYESQLSPSGRH